MLLAWVLLIAGLTVSTLAGAYVVRRSRELGLIVLTCLFSIYVLSANVLVPRLVSVPLAVAVAVIPSGSLLWPFTGQISDMINEIYGKRRAYFAVLLAYLANLLFILFVVLVGSATPIWSSQQEAFWNEYFSLAPRILIASGVAFLVAELVDMNVFARLRTYARKRGEDGSTSKLVKFALLRSAASDLANMAIDSSLFVIIAFAGVLPGSDLVTVLIGSVGVKCLLAVLDSPWFVAFRLLTRDVRPESTGQSQRRSHLSGSL